MADPTEYKELKAEWKNDVSVKSYKKAEVAKHNTKKDLWLIVHGKVYDVTEYARDHPGGLDALTEVGGQDATSAFEDVGHSEDAREILHNFLVGVVEGVPQEELMHTGKETQSHVQVIRRDPPPPEKKDSTGPISFKTGGLAALSIGTAGVIWLGSGIGTSHSSASVTLRPQSTHSTFAQGFLTAMATFGAASIASAYYLSKKTNFASDFTRFPSHTVSSLPKAPFRPVGVIHPMEYRKFKLRSKEELSQGIFKFVFDLPDKYSVLGLPIGQHVAVRGEVDEHTVVRSYTPVSSNRDLGRLELLIRVYPDGKLGNYLKGLNIGDEADIRGPKGAMRYRKGMVNHVGMVGGGTGITPLYQVIRAICEDDSDNTQVSLVYGNRTESDIMMREKLDHFAKVASHKFKVHYVLDQPGPAWTGGKGYVDKSVLEQYMPRVSPSTKILLCGPPGMISATKKNLVALGFETPNAVGKMTDQIFCF